MVPDRIEREILLRHPVERVWAALTTAEGLAGWFGSHAEIELRPGGRLWLRWEKLDVETTCEVTTVEPPRRFGFWWDLDLPAGAAPRRTEVTFTLAPAAEGTRLTLAESGFRQAAAAHADAAYREHSGGWDEELAELVAYLDGSGGR